MNPWYRCSYPWRKGSCEWILDMNATIQIKGSYEIDPRYGHSHPYREDQNKRTHGMVAAIHLKNHVYNHEWLITPRSMEFCDRSPGSYAATPPDQSTNSNMWIDVLKSNMLENHLITDQWCELLTSAKETTNNDNGSQGTTSTIHGMWTVIWHRTPAESLDRRPIMWTCHRMRRTCHWGMQALRYRKGVSRPTS